MLKFRTEAEVLAEWDDMIARVKAGEASLEEAKAFLRKKGSDVLQLPEKEWKCRRSWGENARREDSSICFYQCSITRFKWERAIAKRQAWGVALPDDDEQERMYREWVRLGAKTAKTRRAVVDKERELKEAIAERRGFEAGAAKGNERALTLADEMAEMKKRHKDELEELKASQKFELRMLRERYSYWWERHKVRSRLKAELQGEFAWLYQRVTKDRNKVLAWGGNKSFTLDALREEILKRIWNEIPAELRKGVWMGDDGGFSYDSLKRHYREHLDDFTPSDDSEAASRARLKH